MSHGRQDVVLHDSIATEMCIEMEDGGTNKRLNDELGGGRIASLSTNEGCKQRLRPHCTFSLPCVVGGAVTEARKTEGVVSHPRCAVIRKCGAKLVGTGGIFCLFFTDAIPVVA